MRFVFAILAALLCLAAGPAHAAEGGSDKTADLNAPGPTFVTIAPFVIPVLGANGPERMVSVIITVEVANKEKADFVRARLPRLNDAYLQAMYGALDRGTIRRNGLVDVSLLKDKLTKATAKVLGAGYVDDVLVQAVAERQL